jgi:hypothetical protein
MVVAFRLHIVKCLSLLRYLLNRIGVIIVSVGSNQRQWNWYSTLRCMSKDWLARNKDYVSELDDMSTRVLLF